MKKNIGTICEWLVFTALYIFLIADTGRAMGAQTNGAIEDYVEYYTEEYVGAEGMASAATNAWHYSEFDNLEERFKSDFGAIAVTTVIYILITIRCYDITFVQKHKDMEKSEDTR